MQMIQSKLTNLISEGPLSHLFGYTNKFRNLFDKFKKVGGTANGLSKKNRGFKPKCFSNLTKLNSTS